MVHPSHAARSLATACRYWLDDSAWQMGAALAYYSLFALAPVLISAIAIATFVFGETLSSDEVMSRIARAIGGDGATVVDIALENFRRPAEARWAALIGLGSLWYGAVGVWAQLRSSLNRTWRVKPGSRSLTRVLGDSVLAILLVGVASILALTLLGASLLPSVLDERWSVLVPWSERSFRVADLGASICLSSLLFVAVYRFMSDGRASWRHVWGGALTAGVLFGVGKVGIGYYLGRNFLASAYGAAGSLVAFLVWVYYSAQAFYLGAEVVRVRLGHKRSGRGSVGHPNPVDATLASEREVVRPTGRERWE